MTLMKTAHSRGFDGFATRALSILLCLAALSLVGQSRTIAAVQSAVGWSPPACADEGRSADHERSADCCLLCGARLPGPAFPLAPSVDAAFAPPPARIAWRARHDHGRASRPAGWASAWSSRAPPAVS